ncbi:hypothetical protein NEOKW01_0329 [Nematocida sp. AWRm80]|nr:hypothetical protein NEOKW01_0329 [Nematocida sp. AWRm80]
MLSQYHFREKYPAQVNDPHKYISLEEQLKLPTLEEIEALPDTTIEENSEAKRLQEVGTEILNKIFSGRNEYVSGIKCKGIIRDYQRI